MIVTEAVADVVLLAEDDEVVRRALREELAAQGFVVLEAASGAAALGLLQSYAAAIEWLVTDVDLRDACSGLQVATEFAFLNPTQPVLCITGGVVPRALERMPQVTIVRKPFAPEAVADTLARHRMARAAP